MDFTEIEYDVADHIATIALNRPEKMNAAPQRWFANSSRRSTSSTLTTTCGL